MLLETSDWKKMIVASQGTEEKNPCGLFSLLTSIHTNLSLSTSAIKVRRQDSERIQRKDWDASYSPQPRSAGVSHQVTAELPSHQSGGLAQTPKGERESLGSSLFN